MRCSPNCFKPASLPTDLVEVYLVGSSTANEENWEPTPLYHKLVALFINTKNSSFILVSFLLHSYEAGQKQCLCSTTSLLEAPFERIAQDHMPHYP